MTDPFIVPRSGCRSSAQRWQSPAQTMVWAPQGNGAKLSLTAIVIRAATTPAPRR